MRYNHKYLLCVAVAGLVTVTACNKYLDITPKGYTLLTTVTNYDEWLNDRKALGAIPAELNYLGDNIDEVTIPVPPTETEDLVYTWASQYSEDVTASPTFWGSHYARINKYNTVLVGIDAATGGTEQEKASLKAEALLGRAFEYFYLVNEYGNEYDSSTAETDLAVPFVTSNDVEQTVPPRSTIQEVYDHIITDINTAIPNLASDNSSNRYRGSVAAAYSVLARVYFYARDYTDAAKNAELALQNGSATMLDYNTFSFSTTPKNLPADVIYGRTGIGFYICTLDFLKIFEPEDIRLSQLYYSSDNYTGRGKTYFSPLLAGANALQNPNFGTSVQEMKLIIAEAAAREGDLTTALQQINEIRADRFPASVYQALASDDPETVLNWVLLERQRELSYYALRWFDMRRLDKEGEMDTVYRYDAQNNIIATLLPHSNQYTLQIPTQVLQFNPDMEQNPW